MNGMITYKIAMITSEGVKLSNTFSTAGLLKSDVLKWFIEEANDDVRNGPSII